MATLASTSLTVLRFAQETEFGVPPVGGTHRSLPMTGESLQYTIDKTASEEIDPDRGTADMVPTSAAVSGGVNIELKASAYDPLIEAGLQGTWKPATPTATSVAFTANATGTRFTVPIKLELVKGQFFALQVEADDPNYRKLFRVARVSADPSGTGTEIDLDPATPAVPDSVSNGAISVSRLRNGHVRRSFSVEKGQPDVDVFRMYTGMNVAGWTLNMAQGALSNGEIQFMGRKAMKSTAVSAMPGTLEPVPDRRTMTGMTGAVCGIWIDGKPIEDTFVASFTLTLDNNMRQQNAMCSSDEDGIPGAIGIGNGALSVSGSLEVYFSKKETLYSEYLENRNVEVAFTAFDTEGHGYVFTLPRANVTNNQSNSSGNNADVMATIELTGLRVKSTEESLNGAVLLIDRIDFEE